VKIYASFVVSVALPMSVGHQYDAIYRNSRATVSRSFSLSHIFIQRKSAIFLRTFLANEDSSTVFTVLL
jgi:hypothetical protein